MVQAEYACNDSPNRSIWQSPFHIIYGRHPRGVSELRDLGKAERRGVKGEYFATEFQAIHEQVKQQLQDSNIKYKGGADLKKRKVNFEVRDLVLAHLRKERFPKKEYNKLKFKKIGPCRVLRKFSANAYEIELPPNIGISPIFNVVDLYRYEKEHVDNAAEDQEEQEIDWVKQLPIAKELKPERILDKKILKKTKGQEYFQDMIKWKNQPIVEATWMTNSMLQKLGSSVEELMDKSP